MDDAIRSRLAALTEKIIDATHATTSLVEAENPEPEQIANTNRAVGDIAAEYGELLKQVPEAERERVERSHGRKVIDLRRLAARLPQKMGGQAAKRAADATGSGQPFLLSREPPKSIEPPRVPTVKRGEEGKLRVGGPVDAWCGPCGGVTEHAIVAMVGGEPKQVICQSCHARHGYRTGPARKGASQPAVKAAAQRSMTREEAEARRKEEARFALMKELAEATTVRPFAAREHYKAGEIVQHPEHGRGKIETVLKGSILVRFRDGLKSLSTL